MAREPRFPSRLWKISQSSRTHATHSNASDWQICKNKQEFSDFWAISYRFEHIVMLIIIQMHFVLLTTISLLFVWDGHFWIILKRGRGLSPQSPPFCTCLTYTLSLSLSLTHTHTHTHTQTSSNQPHWFHCQELKLSTNKDTPGFTG